MGVLDSCRGGGAGKWARIFGVICGVVCVITGFAVIFTILSVGPFWIGILCVFDGVVVLLIELPWLFACCCNCAKVCMARMWFLNRTLVKGILFMCLAILCFLGATWCILPGILLVGDGILYIIAHSQGDVGVTSVVVTTTTTTVAGGTLPSETPPNV
eukprot:EC714977.1.p1 GENE.EC714977.1~~EC714977.1.p1  ORF type:complete len:158 (+),score=10.66 EC714977.1:47-520(+)